MDSRLLGNDGWGVDSHRRRTYSRLGSRNAGGKLPQKVGVFPGMDLTFVD